VTVPRSRFSERCTETSLPLQRIRQFKLRLLRLGGARRLADNIRSTNAVVNRSISSLGGRKYNITFQTRLLFSSGG
jgi:hypothetical protein